MVERWHARIEREDFTVGVNGPERIIVPEIIPPEGQLGFESAQDARKAGRSRIGHVGITAKSISVFSVQSPY